MKMNATGVVASESSLAAAPKNSTILDTPQIVQAHQETTYQELEGWMLNDFRRSAVPDALTLANVEVLMGEAAIAVLTEAKLASYSGHAQQYYTNSVTKLTSRYGFAAAGLWVTRAVLGVPYAKAFTPRDDIHKIGKNVKYETPVGATASPIRPQITVNELLAICDRHSIEFAEAVKQITPSWSLGLANADENEWLFNHCEDIVPYEQFWQWVQQNNIPVAITEGLKKALSLMAQGIVAIAIRGITQWHLKGGLELHPEIAQFATKDRTIYAIFDQDTKPKTIANVHIQVRKLGNVLEGKGCKVFCPVWQPDEGKGIDDVIAALGDAGQQRLDTILSDAPTLKQYKRNGQIAACLNSIKRFNSLSFPIKRDTEGEFIPPLMMLAPGAITVLDATMNTGKTHRIGKDWVQPAIADGYHVVVLSPLNSLGQQTAKDWGILHIHEQGSTGEQQRQFWEAVRHRPAVVMCPDSIGKLPRWFFDKPVLLVLDEANQVTEHICQGDTLKSKYAPVMEMIAGAARHAIESGGSIVLSEDGIPDRCVQFWQSISGAETVEVYRHRKRGTPWDVTAYQGPASGYRAMLLNAIKQGDRLLFMTTSQREGKRLERIIKEQCTSLDTSTDEGTSCTVKVVRIDSETNENGAFKLFFKDPDAWLKLNKPDVLILSPSAKSGVSIEGNVSATDAYFDSVWGYFPALATDTHLQLLGRYRPPVPRHIYVPPFILGNSDELQHSPQAIRKRLQGNLGTITQLLDISTSSADLAGVEIAILDYLTEARAVSGSQKVIAKDALIDRLEHSGHIVTMCDVKGDPSISQLWDTAQEGIWQDEAAEIASTEINEALDTSWAHSTLDSMEASREARLVAYKILWRDEFPGVLFDDQNECYEALTKDYGSMRRGVLLHARALNLDAVKESDRAAAESILSGSVRAPHRLPKNYIRAAIIANLDVLSLLDGNPWTNHDERAIAIKRKALKYADEIGNWLRLQINPDQTPVEVVNKLVRKLGLNAVVVGQRGQRGQQIRLWNVPDKDNPVRFQLLKAACDKLSGSVSTICNKDSGSIQTVITTPAPPLNAVSEGAKFKPGSVVHWVKNGALVLVEEIRGAIATLSDETGRLFPAPLSELTVVTLE